MPHISATAAAAVTPSDSVGYRKKNVTKATPASFKVDAVKAMNGDEVVDSDDFLDFGELQMSPLGQQQQQQQQLAAASSDKKSNALLL